jgi:CHASE3 domain sensor protein
MKYHYGASDFGSLDSSISSNADDLVRTDDIKSVKENVCYLDSMVQGNKAIADERIEKLQKELQEFKKATNEFQRHLTGVSIILSVAVVFILILISFYSK